MVSGHKILTFALLSCIMFLATACGRTTQLTTLNYEYYKPARYDGSVYSSWAYVQTVDGRRETVVPNFEIPGMTALVDDRAADLVLEVAASAPAVSNVRTTTVLHKDDQGEHLDYGARGLVTVGTRMIIYDGLANQTLVDKPGASTFDVRVNADYASEAAARTALDQVVADAWSGYIDQAVANARNDLVALHRSEFQGEYAVLPMRLASSAENEPRIAEAYQYLLRRLDPEGAEQAKATYESIGYNVVNVDGEQDKYANVAVAYGLGCCAFILGNFDEVFNQVRIGRTFNVGSENGALIDLERAASDLVSRGVQ